MKGLWWKWKRDPLTIDAVLMYAQRGHGKRSSYYSDYTFGVWRDDELVPVGKAYFGFTDQELAFLDRWIRNHTVARFGPVREVEKSMVLEVAFDAAQLSNRHKSGVALRFPRIARIRTDKPASEADRLESLMALVENRPADDASARRLTASQCRVLPLLPCRQPGEGTMPLVPNNTKRKMQAGEVALGFGVHHLRTAAAPALAAATGHDWLFLDNEHGAFSVSEIAQLCIASLPTGVTPLVRVCANAIDEATRALDNGALGHRHAACRYREGGATHRRGVSLSAAGAAKLGRAAGGLRLPPSGDGGGAEGDQRRDPDRGDDRKSRGGEERRRHRRGRWHRRAADRHLGSVVRTGHRRARWVIRR